MMKQLNRNYKYILHVPDFTRAEARRLALEQLEKFASDDRLFLLLSSDITVTEIKLPALIVSDEE